MNNSSEDKIEAIYYLLTDARRLEDGISNEQTFRESVAEYGAVLLDRKLTTQEIEEIIENR